MRLKTIVVFCILLLIAACTSERYDPKTYSYLPVEKEEAPATEVISSLESESTAPIEGITVVRKDYFVTNPTSSKKIDVSVFQPENNSQLYPGVILVPGGTGSKKDFLKPYSRETSASIAETFAAKGFTVLLFSAEGRGDSDGEEDYNGYVAQDGLYELYRFLLAYENVNMDNIGIVSYSYGIALASGMLGRYQPHLQYYIEWEGPVNRWYVTFECQGASPGKPGSFSCDDEDYWLEREALRFVPYFDIEHFVIVQTEKNHGGPTVRHSVEMNTLALQYLDWVRVNGPKNYINQEYTPETLPVLSESVSYHDEILSYMTEFSLAEKG
ncbi:MAG TPA: hypothetical protein VJJ79_02345 [Candidatus Nanoarchaeia archaeon]|nr:hypothetical protein [Candidatus Nanoarchaeia archaeon]